MRKDISCHDIYFIVCRCRGGLLHDAVQMLEEDIFLDKFLLNNRLGVLRNMLSVGEGGTSQLFVTRDRKAGSGMLIGAGLLVMLLGLIGDGRLLHSVSEDKDEEDEAVGVG